MLKKAQFVPRYYTFTVILSPEELSGSPRLELAMTLLQVNYPPERARFLNEILYETNSLDEYKDRVINEQREKARENFFPGQIGFDWRYTEKISVQNNGNDGWVIKREYGSYIGGAHGLETRRYYVVDLDGNKLLKVDDLFEDFQGDELREIVYTELRNYSGLEEDRPLSEGIYFDDEPEMSFNFFLTQEGLGLHWDPYEIAPYSEGNVEVILPWMSISPLMLKNGVDLLTKFGINLSAG